MTKEYQEASEEFLKVSFSPNPNVCRKRGKLTHRTVARFRADYRLQGHARAEQPGSQGVKSSLRSIGARYSGHCSTQSRFLLLNVTISKAVAARLVGRWFVWCWTGTAHSDAAVQKIEEALLDTIDPIGF